MSGFHASLQNSIEQKFNKDMNSARVISIADIDDSLFLITAMENFLN